MTTSVGELEPARRALLAVDDPPGATRAGVAGAREASGTAAVPTVVVVLPRGEAIRNFVYTGALDEVGREAQVAILSVIPNAGLSEMLRERYEHVTPLTETPERKLVRYAREILDMAHGRWLWSKAAQERWRRREVEVTTTGERLRRETKKLICYPFANRAGLRFASAVERRLSRSLKTTDEYLRLFTRLRPALVFNASHVHGRAAIQAVQAAQWLGIPTATFIFSWDNLTSQGRIIPSYDYYLVWSEGIKRQLLEIYREVRAEQVFVTGTPQFDFHFKPEYHWTREEFCARVGADPLRPIVLYSTGMANHMPGEEKIIEDVAQALRGMKKWGPPQLMVRVYPKDRTGRFEPTKAKCPDILFPEIPWEPAWQTPQMEDSYLLTNMLRHAAAGVNVASTVSLELCMLGKPVINIAYNPANADGINYADYYQFDHYRPVVESGAVELARSADELRELLRQALAQPRANEKAGRELMKKMFGHTLDGAAGTRVAKCLLELARRENGVRPLTSREEAS